MRTTVETSRRKVDCEISRHTAQWCVKMVKRALEKGGVEKGSTCRLTLTPYSRLCPRSYPAVKGLSHTAVCMKHTIHVHTIDSHTVNHCGTITKQHGWWGNSYEKPTEDILLQNGGRQPF